MPVETTKSILFNFLRSIKVDVFFRFLNRKKFLVIMYHGITSKRWDFPVWTQLPEDVFRRQLQFIKAHYNILPLSEAITAFSDSGTFPERTALITFDDGMKNNYEVAFPILKEYSVPATIFLTVDLIGTEKFLWVDELFLLLRESLIQGFPISDLSFIAEKELSKQNLWDIYFDTVERLKKIPEKRKDEFMKEMRDHITLNRNKMIEDFSLLTWNQVMEMKDSGLVDFGVHTANHRILSMLNTDEWEKEIKKPKEELSNILGNEVGSFCYPNGRPGVDFDEDHVRYLRECGYTCAFTTKASLFNPIKGDLFQIGRIPAGNDFTSHPSIFTINTSGLGEYLRQFREKVF